MQVHHPGGPDVTLATQQTSHQIQDSGPKLQNPQRSESRLRQGLTSFYVTMTFYDSCVPQEQA